jgi:hypothetical protein
LPFTVWEASKINDDWPRTATGGWNREYIDWRLLEDDSNGNIANWGSDHKASDGTVWSAGVCDFSSAACDAAFTAAGETKMTGGAFASEMYGMPGCIKDTVKNWVWYGKVSSS